MLCNRSVVTDGINADRVVLTCAQVKVPEEGDEEGGGDGPTRWRHFLVKIKWASSVNITDILQYLKCVFGVQAGSRNYSTVGCQCSTCMDAQPVNSLGSRLARR